MSDPGDSRSHFPASSRWEFDDETAFVFEDMIRRSIPSFGVMREAVKNLALRHLVPFTPVVDLGASLGGACEGLMYNVPTADGNTYVMLEHAPAMLSRARHKWRAKENVTVYDVDLNEEKPLPSFCAGASVVLSILTLQFVSVSERARIIDNVFDLLTDGGAFLFVEKLEVGGALGEVMRDDYRAHKRRAGYSEKAIEAKERALAGVLVPLSFKTNDAMLRAAGFRQVECFWRDGLFCGWIAVK